MIRIVEKSPRARALRYRARMTTYRLTERVGKRLRRWGSAMSWWGGERAHALSTGRAPRR